MMVEKPINSYAFLLAIISPSTVGNIAISIIHVQHAQGPRHQGLCDRGIDVHHSQLKLVLGNVACNPPRDRAVDVHNSEHHMNS